MPGPVFQSGDRVALHTIEEDDLAVFARARNDPDVRRTLARAHPESESSLESFFEDTISAEEGVHLLACVDGDPIGATMLCDVDHTAGTADLAYWVLPEHQGEGLGAAALDLLLYTGFRDQRLHRVQADVLETNDAARGLLASLGFQQEGRFRDAQFQDGAYVDVLRYGLLAEEWRAE
jgi:RimJ/RimL family protein N-acetyltransferase